MKYVKVFFLYDFLCLCTMKVVVSIGRWSDENFLIVVQVVLEER